MERVCGIYCITNNCTGEKYIGQSKNIYSRWEQHKREAQVGNKQYPLYRSMRFWKLNNFSFEIIEKCNEYELNEREQYYMLLYNTVKFGFNQIYVGETRKMRRRKILKGK